MKATNKIPGTTEAWDRGELGEDAAHVRRASPAVESAVDDALGLQMISIRLSKDLIDTFKRLAAYHGVGYQPLMRDALQRFAVAQLKEIFVANTPTPPATEPEVCATPEHETEKAPQPVKQRRAA